MGGLGSGGARVHAAGEVGCRASATGEVGTSIDGVGDIAGSHGGSRDLETLPACFARPLPRPAVIAATAACFAALCFLGHWPLVLKSFLPDPVGTRLHIIAAAPGLLEQNTTKIVPPPARDGRVAAVAAPVVPVRGSAGPRYAYATGGFGTTCKYFDWALTLAEDLGAVASRYPLVVLVDELALGEQCLRGKDPGHLVVLRSIKHNYTSSCYVGARRGYWVKSWGDAIKKFECWHLTEYQAIVWLDSDVKIFENIDAVFEQHSTERRITGQYDGCPGLPNGVPPHFSSGMMLFSPDALLVQEMLNFSNFYYGSGGCQGGDQLIIRDFFVSSGRAVGTFSTRIVTEPKCIKKHGRMPALLHCNHAARFMPICKKLKR
mmetsp:Transcript_117336/g.332020  ORF Transcript_117336/g.332020 Transcript_117336/m.332020 type:complete len:376 (+) Transcript_117336:57-1184(+)